MIPQTTQAMGITIDWQKYYNKLCQYLLMSICCHLLFIGYLGFFLFSRLLSLGIYTIYVYINPSSTFALKICHIHHIPLFLCGLWLSVMCCLSQLKKKMDQKWRQYLENCKSLTSKNQVTSDLSVWLKKLLVLSSMTTNVCVYLYLYLQTLKCFIWSRKNIGLT